MELGLCQIFVEVNKFILGKQLPNFQYTKYALPAIIKVMINENDGEILTDSLQALSYFTDGHEERI